MEKINKIDWNNQEEVKQYKREYRINNKDREKLTQKNYIIKNIDKVKKMRRDYMRKYYYLTEPNKNALVRANTNSKIRLEIIKERQFCELCKSKKNLEIHHIKYSQDKDYLQLLCRNCHRDIHRSLD